MVHGDDFTALGTDRSLDIYEKALLRCFDLKLRGRVGEGPKDCKELRLLNRILRVVPQGLRYEADPRHQELLARSLGIAQTRYIGTPGVKRNEDVDTGPESNEQQPHDYHDDDRDPHNTATVSAAIPVRRPQPRIKETVVDGVARRCLKHVRFDKQPTVPDITPYAEIYGKRPRSFVFIGPIVGDISEPWNFQMPAFKFISVSANPFTGKVASIMSKRCRQNISDSSSRLTELRKTLFELGCLGALGCISVAELLWRNVQKAKTEKIRCKESEEFGALAIAGADVG